MSLATRCPACGTIFRVVQDQLRVSQGWVRCGRCTEAFNALESMVELTPPRVPAPAEASAAASAAHGPADALEQVPDPGPAASDPAGHANPVAYAAVAADAAMPRPPAGPASIELPPGMEIVASDGAVGEAADVPRPPPHEPDAGADATPAPAAPAAAGPGWTADEPTGAEDPPPPAASAPAADGAADAVLQAVPAEPDVAAPSFIVEAERAERWRRPGVRLALGCGVLLAALALLGQGAYTFRDRLAAASPALKPALVQACVWLDCRVGDVRQIDALSVETSGLVRVEGSAVHRLSVTLRNRATIDIAAPALDLALTDAQGRPIARRVLQMADLDLPLRVLKAGSELPIQVPLGIGDRQVSGYTVEIFYP